MRNTDFKLYSDFTIFRWTTLSLHWPQNLGVRSQPPSRSLLMDWGDSNPKCKLSMRSLGGRALRTQIQNQISLWEISLEDLRGIYCTLRETKHIDIQSFFLCLYFHYYYWQLKWQVSCDIDVKTRVRYRTYFLSKPTDHSHLLFSKGINSTKTTRRYIHVTSMKNEGIWHQPINVLPFTSPNERCTVYYCRREAMHLDLLMCVALINIEKTEKSYKSLVIYWHNCHCALIG